MHLEQSGVVRPVVLCLPLDELHLVSPAGQVQLVGFEQRGGIYRVAVDETHQVLAVVFPKTKRSPGSLGVQVTGV